jgi:acyl carrier protein
MTAVEPLAPDVLDVVRRCVAESLAVDPAEVHPDSRLIDDLGADSLDFVDIVFMVEQELDVKMRESELNFLTRLDFSSPEVMRDGHLTPDVVASLACWLPSLRGEDTAHLTPARVFSLITVEAICLAAQRQRVPPVAAP